MPKIHYLEAQQDIPIDLDRCWKFFSDPRNLPKITPPWLAFDTSETRFAEMYPGLVLTYIVRPLLGIPMSWVTEITHVQAPKYFVDEQRFGPYRFWHHQHHFEPIPGGTRVIDKIHYAVPGGPLFSGIIHSLSVKSKLAAIFEFRRQAMEEVFGKMPNGSGR